LEGSTPMKTCYTKLKLSKIEISGGNSDSTEF